MRAQTLGALATLVWLSSAAAAQQVGDEIPLAAWQAPLYWQAAAGAREIDDAMTAGGNATAVAAAPMALPLVAMETCRLVDTRLRSGLGGELGPPALSRLASRTFAIRDSTACSLPVVAAAYSLKVTLIPQGRATVVYFLPRGRDGLALQAASSRGARVASNALVVPVSADGAIEVEASAATELVIDVNGYYAPPAALAAGASLIGGHDLAAAASSGVRHDKSVTFNGLTNSITVDSVPPPAPGKPNELYLGGDNTGGPGSPVPFSKIKLGIGTRAISGDSTVTVFNPQFPALDITPGAGRLQLAVATAAGSYSSVASPGDSVIRANAGQSQDLILAASNGNQGAIRFTTGFAAACNTPDAESQKMVLTRGGDLGIGPSFKTGQFCEGPKVVSQRLDVDGRARIRVLPTNNALNNLVVAEANGDLAVRTAGTLIGPQGPQGPPGPQGPAGAQGPPGPGGSGVSGSCSTGPNVVSKWSSPTALTCSQIFDNGVSVGIGTNAPSPNHKVEIQAADPNPGASALLLRNLGNGLVPETGVTFQVNNSLGGRIYAKFDSQNSYDARLTLQSRGGLATVPFDDDTLNVSHKAVGIGTINPNPTFTPDLRLAVAGKVRVDMLTAGGQAVCRDANNLLSLCGVSDAHLKTNVVPLANALERLSRIRGVTFDWNEASRKVVATGGRREIGVVAQEVEAVFPELVTDQPEGYKTVDYSRLAAVLVEGLKELKAENDSLRRRVDAMESAGSPPR